MPLLNMRLVTPDHLVYLGRIPDLDLVEERGGNLFVGAMARQRDVELSPLVRHVCPLLSEALPYVGHRQTRNSGTIGGNFAQLAPAAELLAMGAAMDVVLHAARRDGTRDIPVADFAVDYAKSCLEPDELLTGLTFPLWRPEHGQAFVEFALRPAAPPIVGAAALARLASDGTIEQVAVGLTGVGSGPIRLHDFEEDAVGERIGERVLRAAAAAGGDTEAYSDVRASADYRRRLAAVLSRRALGLALERAAGKLMAERNGRA
jgi:carbon-monoxide dehydrogenase medium subunit